MSDADAPCPVCGESNRYAVSAPALRERWAAAFAYFSFIPAAIFLLLARFKTNRFVRFHAFQSIFLVCSAALLAGILWIIFVTFSFIPFLAAALIVTLVSLGCFVLWMVLLVKAFQGKRFKLPWIGDLAEKQATG